MPEHDPPLYWLAGQLMLEHVLQPCPLDVPEHDPLRYFPVAQLMLEHVLQPYPLDVPEHDPPLYFPVPQLMLEQVAHTRLVVDEQAWVWYLPAPQVAAQAVQDVWR